MKKTLHYLQNIPAPPLFSNIIMFAHFLINNMYKICPRFITTKSIKNIFLHIVMKVALVYTQNRSKSSTFLQEKS
jgi:hypothetical protein